MYEKIRSRKSVPSLYEAQLLVRGVFASMHADSRGCQAEEVLTPESAAAVRSSHEKHLGSELAVADSFSVPLDSAHMLKDQWSGLVWPTSSKRNVAPETGVEISRLQDVGRASVAIPDEFVRL